MNEMTVEQERDRLKHLLLDMIRQNCDPVDNGGEYYTYFSGFISTHAEAMVFVCERGWMELVSDNGGRVVSCREKK
jgi:hypothetical protein